MPPDHRRVHKVCYTVEERMFLGHGGNHGDTNLARSDFPASPGPSFE